MGAPVVALVLVSHSRALADGLAEVAGQMAPDVALLPAGGTDDGGLGTGFDRILGALEAAVADGRSAVVLTDLGSAVLTTESVLETMEPDAASRVRVADAPFVEGAVEAAVVAQGGAGLDDVHRAAEGAGATFAAGPRGSGADPQTSAGPRPVSDAAEPEVGGGGGVPDGATGAAVPDGAAGGGVRAGAGGGPVPDAGAAGAPTPAPGSGEGPTARGTAVLRNRLGLHARPAASLARTAGAFASTITVNGADARSVLALVALGAVGGSEVVVAAHGPDARTAVNALVAELEEGFGEA